MVSSGGELKLSITEGISSKSFLILVWKSYNAKRYVLKSTRMIRKLFTNFFFQLE